MNKYYITYNITILQCAQELTCTPGFNLHALPVPVSPKVFY